MTLDDYSTQAITTDTFSGKPVTKLTEAAFVSKLLGLVGEAGEVAEKCKKIVRDKEARATNEDIIELQKELGDVLWYINAMCHYLGVTLEETARLNLEKVHGRKARGVSRGSGDNR
jgi:NTP pyrophosphatase (non-canonical NTP hydrolase)